MTIYLQILTVYIKYYVYTKWVMLFDFVVPKALCGIQFVDLS